MANDVAQLSRHDLEAKIVKRCWEDAAFRGEFVANPAATFTKYLGIPAAKLPGIQVHEEPHGSWHIVLPARPANADELSDADLERVAGGIPTPSIAAAIATASLMSVATAATVSVSAGQTLDDGW